MKNSIRRLFNTFSGLTPDNLKIDKLIEITSRDPFQRMQETRKRNLQRVIQIFYGSSVAKFSELHDKNIFFVAGLIKPFTNNLCKTISNKTARIIECKVHIKSGILDIENDPEFEQNYVPYIDIEQSFKNSVISVSESRPNIYVDPTKYNVEELVILDTEGFEFVSFSGNESNGYINPLGGQYLINRNTNKKIQVYKKYGSKTEQLEFHGEIIK